MGEQVDNRNNKRKLNIDWEEVLPGRNEEVPPELIVKKAKPPTPTFKSTTMGVILEDSSTGEELASHYPDQELRAQIERLKDTYPKLRHQLVDKGDKLLARITRLEKEQERRRLVRAETVSCCSDVDECYKPRQSTSSDSSDCFTQRSPSCQIQSKPSFASVLSKKIEENRSREANAFDEELCILARCDRREMRPNGELSKREIRKDRSSSRKRPFHEGDKSFISSGFQKDRASTPSPTHQTRGNWSSCPSKKKYAVEVLPSKRSRPRKEQALVLLDEDESPVATSSEGSEETLHIQTIEQADELAACMKDAKIYYPSRVDPESIEISYMDINHLAPAAYLTSPIMNFYIRYLQPQASPANRAIQDCHFFNTYFYSKLKEAVSHRGGHKDSFFSKFRRWWKGVNIFQKSYVLIPIHEDVHWSLVIICIPDKEDESGPIILHLDSLKLHCSLTIFSNIRSFLKEEWNYLKQEVSPSDLPIADRIWQHLDRRIDEKIISVPQQKNDYDCGLFVLFFMERFIEEAPERLKKKDLAMFGKKWFRPEEASGLRVRIRNLLTEQFQLASAECCNSYSSSSRGGI